MKYILIISKIYLRPEIRIERRENKLSGKAFLGGKDMVTEEKYEFFGQIMDILEDFLEEIGVSSNEDPLLTGEYYDTVKSKIEETCVNWGVIINPKINLKEALKNFYTAYPAIKNVQIVGGTNDGNGIVVFVGDGFHAISETEISIFHRDIKFAKKEKLGR